ncbi:MAG: hypothetical protein V1739_04650 [Candidatus Omnitrophota bacterium]
MAHNRQVKCPMCGEYIEWEDNLKLGEVTYCSDCDEELKIVNIDPPQAKRMVELLEVNNGSYKGFYEDNYDKDDDDTGDNAYREQV